MVNKFPMKKEFVYVSPKCGIETFVGKDGVIGIRSKELKPNNNHAEIKGVHLINRS